MPAEPKYTVDKDVLMAEIHRKANWKKPVFHQVTVIFNSELVGAKLATMATAGPPLPSPNSFGNGRLQWADLTFCHENINLQKNSYPTGIKTQHLLAWGQQHRVKEASVTCVGRGIEWARARDKEQQREREECSPFFKEDDMAFSKRSSVITLTEWASDWKETATNGDPEQFIQSMLDSRLTIVQ